MNALGEAAYLGRLERADAISLAALILSLPWKPRFPAWRRVLELTGTAGRRRTADLEYVALAERLGCAVVTADGPLEDTARQRGLPGSVTLVTEHPWAR